MKRLKIIADSKIPYLEGVLEPFAEMVYLSPEAIDASAIKDADALIIRTRTKCNAALLEGSSVKMIATATIGFDHIDRSYCNQKGISWKNAPGCNASSVAQYILSALQLFSIENHLSLSGKTIGIVGVGNVGKSVEQVCRLIGLRVLCCDPPRARQENANGFVDLDTIARESDFITFHTPLTYEGENATYHMASYDFFSKVKKKPVIINTSRGEVIKEDDLKEAYRKGIVSGLILDCWEHEPHINLELMSDAFLSTPHIAGYSADGKSNATRMAVKNIADFFGLTLNLTSIIPPEALSPQIDASEYPENTLSYLLLRTYDPREDSNRLRKSPATFEKQRGDYPLRREYAAYTVCNCPSEIKSLIQKLGFKIVD